MILFWLIAVLLLGGVLAAITARWSSTLARSIALAATLIDFGLVLFLWVRHAGHITLLSSTAWLEQVNWTWIPQLGIHFHLAVDGLSLLLLALTFFVGALSQVVWATRGRRITGRGPRVSDAPSPSTRGATSKALVGPGL